MRKRLLGLLLIALLLLPSIAGAEGALMDDRGVAIPTAVPRRVVSLYGSYAEAWAQAGGTLVGATEDAVSERGMDLGEAQIIGTTKEPNLEPVSYTHLDVYKRQGERRLDARFVLPKAFQIALQALRRGIGGRGAGLPTRSRRRAARIVAREPQMRKQRLPRAFERQRPGDGQRARRATFAAGVVARGGGRAQALVFAEEKRSQRLRARPAVAGEVQQIAPAAQKRLRELRIGRAETFADRPVAGQTRRIVERARRGQVAVRPKPVEKSVLNARPRPMGAGHLRQHLPEFFRHFRLSGAFKHLHRRF